MATSPASHGSSTASLEAAGAAEGADRSVRWTWLIAAAYVLVLWVWLAENYRLLAGPGFLERDVAGAVVNVVAPGIVGLLVRRWWAIGLPFASLALALPLQIAGSDGRGFDPLSPLAAAVLISLLYGVPAAAIGTAIGKFVARISRTHPRALDSPSAEHTAQQQKRAY